MRYQCKFIVVKGKAKREKQEEGKKGKRGKERRGENVPLYVSTTTDRNQPTPKPIAFLHIL